MKVQVTAIKNPTRAQKIRIAMKIELAMKHAQSQSDMEMTCNEMTYGNTVFYKATNCDTPIFAY
jgi:hypothetical protein